jgi:putative tryptophan/tyrosine transport system ATP-binding protein
MLEIERLSLTFSKGTVNEHLALSDISLHLEPGDFVTVLGSNGSGKSSLFNAVCGTHPPDGGRVILEGRDITWMQEHKRARIIGRLFQDPMKGTAPDMTIEENLALAYARGVRGPFSRAVKKNDQAFFRGRLADFHMGLENRMKTKVGLLSGGQRQAMTLLMATIACPKLLLLDEHTAALDPNTAETVLNITREIVARQKITTMMITHNMVSALALGNRTIMMDAGRIVLDIQGKERGDMTVDGLLERFAKNSGSRLDNDRVLLSMKK